jgi:hypothetical protein
MHTTDLKKMTLILGFTLISIGPAMAATKRGGDSGGGGDALETRVNEIRSDLLNWIEKGGAKELELPADISYGEYYDKMTDILVNKKVALSFTPDPVKVNGVEKTCRGFFVITKTLFSEKKSDPQILCNITRFKDTIESKQYPLIHHEYAGLVNIEKNEGSASDYEISKQLTDFLEDKIVKKLAVKKKPEAKIEKNPNQKLEQIFVKHIDTFKVEETLEECRPFHEQLFINQQTKFDTSIKTFVEMIIAEYYEANKLNKVDDITFISKNINNQLGTTKSQMEYIFAVNAGSDSIKIKFSILISGKYYFNHREDVSNYVDKLGRIQVRKLNCYLENQFKFNSDDYNNGRPEFVTSLTNLDSGFKFKNDQELMNLYTATTYESISTISKDL